MTAGEWLAYSGLFLGGCFMTGAWARYGFLETGLLGPLGSRAGLGAAICLAVMWTVCVKHKLALNVAYGTIAGIGLPLVWYLIQRYLVLPPGMPEFNRAKTASNHWAQRYYQAGVVLEDRGKALRGFNLAHKALRLLEIAIAKQSGGAPSSHCNVVATHHEMALLYRMMNQFDEAERSLDRATGVLDGLLREQPDNAGFLKLKSLVVFRQAEIAHALGKRAEARAKYAESHAIDRMLGDLAGMYTTEKLARKLD